MRGWGAEMGKDCIVGCRKKMTGTRVVSQGGTDSEGRKAIGASRHSVSMMLCQGKNSLPLWTCHVGGIHQHNWIILLCSPNSKARIRSGAFWLDRDMRATWVVQGHELSLAATDSWDDTMGRDGTSTSSHHQLRLLRRPVASFVRKVFNLKGGVLTSGSFKCCGKSCFTFQEWERWQIHENRKSKDSDIAQKAVQSSSWIHIWYLVVLVVVCWWWWLWWFVLLWIVNGLVVLCATVASRTLPTDPLTILNLELGHRLTLLPDEQDGEDDGEDD